MNGTRRFAEIFEVELLFEIGRVLAFGLCD